MSDIKIKPKPRKDPDSQMFIMGDKESTLVVGRDYALQNEIDAKRRETVARSCFRGCRTCGKCANSQRDATVPRSFDSNAGKMIDCRGCEPFSYHDCESGVMRNSRQAAEPFTPDQYKLLNETGGKPLI